MSKIDFSGRVAAITGAGGGLGRIHALELARLGARVVVNDMGGARDGLGGDQSAADMVVQEIREAGGQAVASYDNVATVEGGATIVKTAIESFGKLDILVNNAGILRDKSFAKMEDAQWDAVIAVHLRGTYCVTRPAFVHMKEQGYGRIVMTTSSSGLFGSFGQANYGAAKTAMIGLTNVINLEGAKYGIKANLIAPTAATRMTEDIMPPEIFAKLKPECVTPAVLYLCSEDCQDAGMIINAAGGYYSRSAIVTGPGAALGDGTSVPTPEEIRDNWQRITALEPFKLFSQGAEILGELGPLLL